MTVGVLLIGIMIQVGNSLVQYGRPFHGEGGLTTSIYMPDNVTEESFTSGPGDIAVIIDPDDEDGCCDDVATIEFSDVMKPSLRDND
jgi:hypothetical protein